MEDKLEIVVLCVLAAIIVISDIVSFYVGKISQNRKVDEAYQKAREISETELATLKSVHALTLKLQRTNLNVKVLQLTFDNEDLRLTNQSLEKLLVEKVTSYKAEIKRLKEEEKM